MNERVQKLSEDSLAEEIRTMTNFLDALPDYLYNRLSMAIDGAVLWYKNEWEGEDEPN